MINENELMRKYADLLEDKKPVIKESIESGMVDIVEKRMRKTLGMIENLQAEISEDAPDTAAALAQVGESILTAINNLAAVRTGWEDEVADIPDEEMSDSQGPYADNMWA